MQSRCKLAYYTAAVPINITWQIMTRQVKKCNKFGKGCLFAESFTIVQGPHYSARTCRVEKEVSPELTRTTGCSHHLHLMIRTLPGQQYDPCPFVPGWWWHAPFKNTNNQSTQRITKTVQKVRSVENQWTLNHSMLSYGGSIHLGNAIEGLCGREA